MQLTRMLSGSEPIEASSPLNYKKVSFSFSYKPAPPTPHRHQNFSMCPPQQYAPTGYVDTKSNPSEADGNSEAASLQSAPAATVPTKPKKKSDQSETRERLNTIRSFYGDPEVDRASMKTLIRINPMSMMYMGINKDNSHLLKTANYLRHEIPIRLAHMIKEIRGLPFIVAINPFMLEIHERCIKTFHAFEAFDKEIKDATAEKQFNQIVFEMLEMNKDLLVLLCDGFKDSRRFIKNEEFIKNNLNRILSARLGIRLLCEHHIALSKQSCLNRQEPVEAGSSNGEPGDYMMSNDENYVGIINKKFSPRKLIEKSGRMVSRICMDKYGVAPKLKVDGHTNVEFPYLPLPLEYILPELLKNSFRATVENHRESPALPDVNATIALNEKECIIRLRDRGGGIPHHLCGKIFDYHFSTVRDILEDDTEEAMARENSVGIDSNYNNSPIGMFCEATSSRGLAVMHGYGFGLPTSKAYAEYLGGSLTFQSMQGIGSDFYLRIALIDDEPGRVRI